jgi:uncharacterized membrane protein YhaH (DUF805 family)
MSNVFPTAFAFRGRIGRASYWLLNIFCGFALFVSSVSVALTANYTNASPVNVFAAAVAIVGVFIFLASCVAFFGTGVRRLHDRGKSGLWIILYYPVYVVLFNLMLFIQMDDRSFDARVIAAICIAAAITVWSIIDLAVLKGKPADNRYGPVVDADAT